MHRRRRKQRHWTKQQPELVLAHSDKSDGKIDDRKSTGHPPTPPQSRVKLKQKINKKLNCFGKLKGSGNGTRHRFSHFIRPDQEIHPFLPAQEGRSGKQKKDPGWIHRNNLLMDSGASISILFNRYFLDYILPLTRFKEINSGGGQFKSKFSRSLTKALHHLPLPKKGYLYNQDAVANILSMAKVSDEYRITMDTNIDNAIYVHNDDGSYIRFHRTNQNVYEIQIGDCTDMEECHALTTVKENGMQYSALDQKRAEAVQSLQEQLGFPSDTDLANAIDYNVIQNCQFNRRDIRIANNIFGPSVAAIKGKSTRHQNKMKQSDIITDIPQEILDNYEDVHLDINIMFVNKCAYFTSILRHIGLIHCVPIASRESKRVANAMQRIIDQYRSRGFKVTTVDGDNKFKGMDKWMTDKSITLNTCDTNVHVLTIDNRFATASGL